MSGIPVIVALISALIGAAFAVGGTYVLAGLGWAMLVAAIPFLLFAWILFKGLGHGK